MLNAPIRECFSLRVPDDSMCMAGIRRGDLVIAHAQSSVKNGQFAVVLVGDDETPVVRQVFRFGLKVTLATHSPDPAWKHQTYNLLNTRVRVLGKVVVSWTSF